MNQRRPRGRNNNNNNRGRHQNPRNQTFDSNGPEGRVRGSATQVLERYLAQARDAQAAGDGVLAENLFQHAEHYYRVLSAANAQMEQQRERQASQDDRRNPRNDAGDGRRNDEGEDGENRDQARENAARSEPSAARQSEDRPQDEPVSEDRPAPEAEPKAKADEEAAEPSEPAKGEEIDAAFLKAPPKPRRRRRPIAETEAAD